MKLTEQEKQKMRDYRYDDIDIKQVQMAASRYCKYTDEKGKPLTAKQVIEMLGREVWFSGILRAAFHWNCGRGEECKNYVNFRLLRNVQVTRRAYALHKPIILLNEQSKDFSFWR